MKTLPQIRSNKPIVTLFSRIATAAALTLITSAPAALAQTYNFTFTGNSGIDATGTITVSGGIGQSGSISVINVPLEAPPHTPLTTAAGDLLTAGGDVRNHDGDVITYDTVANPLSDPVFDSIGVCFASGPYQDSVHYNTLINIWGNSPGSYGMFIGEANPADLAPDGTLIPGRDAQWVYVYNETGTMTFTLVPEPSTLALLGIGAISFLAYAWRRRRKQSA